MGAGTIMIWNDYPECEVGQEKFRAWIDKHEVVPEEDNAKP